ncbi:MAG: hypothetical protein ACI3U8_08280 [Candidatus Onthomonas sp.]
MEPLTAVVALLAAFGLAALLWLCLGRLLLPVGAMEPVQVSLMPGPSLEQNLKGLQWLAAVGLLDARVTVIDPGLLPQERAETLRLLRRWPGIPLVSAERRH